MVRLVDNSANGKKVCGTILNEWIGFFGFLQPGQAQLLKQEPATYRCTAFRSGGSRDHILGLLGCQNPSREANEPDNCPGPPKGAVGISGCQQQDCEVTWGRTCTKWLMEKTSLT